MGQRTRDAAARKECCKSRGETAVHQIDGTRRHCCAHIPSLLPSLAGHSCGHLRARHSIAHRVQRGVFQIRSAFATGAHQQAPGQELRACTRVTLMATRHVHRCGAVRGAGVVRAAGKNVDPASSCIDNGSSTTPAPQLCVAHRKCVPEAEQISSTQLAHHPTRQAPVGE